jgi:hypothetical protein
MSKSPFVSLIFRGPRFQQAAMPVEALPELAAYRDVVLAVAKVLYQRQNPQRQRLPKGFEAGLRLVVDRVEAGSAVPIVSRVIDPTTELFPVPPGPDIFDDARDLVEQAIAAGAQGSPLPEPLRTDILARFNAFGRTLREGESIVVARPGKREGAVYDRHVRRRLILQAQASYEDEVDLVGEVRAADKDAEGFALRTEDGRKIDVRTPPLFFRLVLRSLGESALVRVRGTGVFDGEGALQRVTMATDVSLAEEDGEPSSRPGCRTPVETQVESLTALAPGWFEGTGPAYDPVQAEWLAKLLRGLLEGFQLPTPYVYPTPEGLARVEWSSPHWEIIANVDLEQTSADVITARTDSDELHELTVRFVEPGAESKLGRFLVDHLQAR